MNQKNKIDESFENDKITSNNQSTRPVTAQTRPTSSQTNLNIRSRPGTSKPRSLKEKEKENPELTEIKEFIQTCKSEIKQMKSRPKTARNIPNRSGLTRQNSTKGPSADNYTLTKEFVRSDIKKSNSNLKTQDSSDDEQKDKPGKVDQFKLELRGELNENNFLKKMNTLGKNNNFKTTVDSLNRPRVNVDLHGVRGFNRSMSMSSANPSARQDRKTFSLSSHRKKVFGEGLSANQVDGKLNERVHHFIDNAKQLKARKHWQDELLHEKGVLNDDALHNEGLSVVKTDVIKSMDVLTKGVNLYEGTTFDKSLTQKDETFNEKTFQLFKEQMDQLSQDAKNPNLQQKHVAEQHKKEWKQFQRQTLENKKQDWLDINPLKPFQETGSLFQKSLKKVENQNTSQIEETERRSSLVTSSKKKLQNSKTLEDLDIKSNQEEEIEQVPRRESEFQQSNHINKLNNPTEQQKLIYNVPNFMFSNYMNLDENKTDSDFDKKQKYEKMDEKSFKSLKNSQLKNKDYTSFNKTICDFKINNTKIKNIDKKVEIKASNIHRSKSQISKALKRSIVSPDSKKSKNKLTDTQYDPNAIKMNKFMKNILKVDDKDRFKNYQRFQSKTMNLNKGDIENFKKLIF